MPNISVVIITYNEERNLKRCLDSVQGIADEIVIVDSFSTDKTEEISKTFKNVRFIKNEFLGHIEQKNYAITQATYPHVLSLDADEALSEELQESILKIKDKWEYDGYYFNRLTNYCGKWIRYTSWYPSKKLRLWDSRKGQWGGANPHDRFIMIKGSSTTLLEGDLLHYSYYSINEHLDQIRYFTDIVAESYYEKGISVNYFIIFFHPIWRFIRDFIFKKGFLSGFYGLVISVNASHETFLKYVKLKKLISDRKDDPLSRICFFNTTRAWGGGEKWHLDISTRLHKKGYETLIITNKRSELFNRIKDTNSRYLSIRVSNLSFLSIYKIYNISKILKREKIKTIIINLSSDLKVAGFAAKIAGVHNIIYRRGSAIPIRNTFLNRYIFKNIVTQIIANSEETKRTVLARNPNLFSCDKISVIYNGINLVDIDSNNTAPVYERQNGELLIGNAGRLVKQKGQRHLIDIVKHLKDKGIHFKMLIAGEGKLRDELESYAEKLDVKDFIVFLGFVNDMPAFMRTIDIFCLTSLWEGFGYVLVEAMACKVPVVAFDTSSNPEIIADNETGYLVKYDDVNTFADKVETLALNQKLRNDLGNNGRKRVEEIFDISHTLNNVEKLISNYNL